MIRIPGLRLPKDPGKNEVVESLNDELRSWVHAEGEEEGTWVDDGNRSVRQRKSYESSSVKVKAASAKVASAKVAPKAATPGSPHNKHITVIAKQLEAVHITQDKAYYDALPFRPGVELFALLGPADFPEETAGAPRHFKSNGGNNKRCLPGNEYQLPRNRQDGFLHVPIAETVVCVGPNKKTLLTYNNKRGLVESWPFDEQASERVAKCWRKGALHNTICAVHKVPNWQAPDTSETRVVLDATLNRHISKVLPKELLQVFVRSKGSKAAVYRAKWRRDKPHIWLNIVSNMCVNEAVATASMNIYEKTAALAARVAARVAAAVAADAATATAIVSNNAVDETAAPTCATAKGRQPAKMEDCALLVTPIQEINGEERFFMTEPRVIEEQHNSPASLASPACPVQSPLGKNKEEDNGVSQFLKAEQEISPWLCPSSGTLGDISVFKVNTKDTQMSELLKRIVRHLERRLRKMYGLSKVSFGALTCDFVKDNSGALILVGIKGFELSPAAFDEAVGLQQELDMLKQEKGEFYDSDDEAGVFQARKEANRLDVAGLGAGGGADLTRAAPSVGITRKVFVSSTHKKCCLCSRQFELGTQCKDNISSSKKSKKQFEGKGGGEDHFQNADQPETRNTTTSLRSLEVQGAAMFEGKRRHLEENLSAIREKNKTNTKIKTRSRLPIEVPPEFSDKRYELKVPPPCAFELTEVMAMALRMQLALRGNTVAAFDHVEQFSTNSAEVGTIAQKDPLRQRPKTGSDIFHVCPLCFELWQANRRCLKAGRNLGELLLPSNTANTKHVRLPGDPGYGPRPGSALMTSDGIDPWANPETELSIDTSSMTDVTASVIATGGSSSSNGGGRHISSIGLIATTMNARRKTRALPHSSMNVSSYLTAKKLTRVLASTAASEDVTRRFQHGVSYGERKQYRVVFFFQELIEVTPAVLHLKTKHMQQLQQPAKLLYEFQPFVEQVGIGKDMGRVATTVKACETHEDPAGDSDIVNNETLDETAARRQRSAHVVGKLSLSQWNVVHTTCCNAESRANSFRQDSLHVRQVRVHYIMANKEGLQWFFMNKRIPVQVELCSGANDQPACVFNGVMFLTRFLTSFNSGNFRQSMINFTVDLHNAAKQSISLRVSVGVIADGICMPQLEPALPFNRQGEILYFPSNYFDMRPLPSTWIEGLVKNSSSGKSVSSANTATADDSAAASTTTSRAGTVKRTLFQQLEQHLVKKGVSKKSSLLEAISVQGLSLMEDHELSDGLHDSNENVAGEMDEEKFQRAMGMFYETVRRKCKGSVDRMGILRAAMHLATLQQEAQAPAHESVMTRNLVKDDNGSDEDIEMGLLEKGGLSAQAVRTTTTRSHLLKDAEAELDATLEDDAVTKFLLEAVDWKMVVVMLHKTNQEENDSSPPFSPAPIHNKHPGQVMMVDKKSNLLQRVDSMLPDFTAPRDTNHVLIEKDELIPLLTKRLRHMATQSAKLEEEGGLNTSLKSHLCATSNAGQQVRAESASSVVTSPSSRARQSTISAKSYAVRSLALFSKNLRKEAVVRRALRLKMYARIWNDIDVDNNGAIDVAELRAYMRQRQISGSSGLGYSSEWYAKDFAEWSLREMHYHLCFWLGTSERARSRFERYDNDGSGSISWLEFVFMAEQAFAKIAEDEISFSLSEALGTCPTHGLTTVFSLDLACFKCEVAKHDPAKVQNQDLFSNMAEQELSQLRSAAGRMLMRLRPGTELIANDLHSSTSSTEAPNTAAAGVQDSEEIAQNDCRLDAHEESKHLQHAKNERRRLTHKQEICHADTFISRGSFEALQKDDNDDEEENEQFLRKQDELSTAHMDNNMAGADHDDERKSSDSKNYDDNGEENLQSPTKHAMLQKPVLPPLDKPVQAKEKKKVMRYKKKIKSKSKRKVKLNPLTVTAIQKGRSSVVNEKIHISTLTSTLP